MKRIFAFLFFSAVGCQAAPALAAPVPCARVNPAIVDSDGTPMCPEVVKQTTAFAIVRCGMEQARSWHPPTQGEIAGIKTMLTAFKARDYAQMRKSADGVGLQVCRVVNGADKYLLVFTKYGVRDYNGPFFGLRDTAKVSRITVIAPHVGTDYAGNPVNGFQNSQALGYIQNGHPKGINGRASDFSHSKTTLGFYAVKHYGDLFRPAVMHVHGMSAGEKSLYRPFQNVMAKPFERAVRKLTNIEKFVGFNAFYEIDPPISTGGKGGPYVKTEIPVRIWRNYPTFMEKLVREIEKEPFAWHDVPEPTLEPEPEGGEESEHDAPIVTDDDHDPADVYPVEINGPPQSAATAWAPPKPRSQVGTKTLTCAATHYTNKSGISKAQCSNLAAAMVKWYGRASRGKLTLVPKTVEMSFDYPAPWGRGSDAPPCTAVREKFKSNFYILPLLYKTNGNHASRCAFVTQMTTWVVAHELGHILGMGHSGAYNADGSYAQYGDNGFSVMADALGSQYITAPQMHHLGWLNPDEIAVYKPDVKEYVFGRADNYFAGPGLGVVMINPALLSAGGDGRVGFVGAQVKCAGCVAFYRVKGGASAKVADIKDEWRDPKSGLHIKILSKGTAGTRVAITTP